MRLEINFEISKLHSLVQRLSDIKAERSLERQPPYKTLSLLDRGYLYVFPLPVGGRLWLGGLASLLQLLEVE